MFFAIIFGVHLSQLGAEPAQPEEMKRAQLYEIYQKQIPLMEQYIQRDPQGPQAATFLFRLGEAYFESAKYAQIQEQNSKAILFAQKAVQALEKLRNEHPYYDRMDEALLVLASTYLENAQEEKAGPVLADLAERYPNSEVIAKSSHLLGDFYFAQERYAKAQHFYEKAARNESSAAYAYYRLAWVALQQSQAGLALKNFEQVIKISTTDKSQAFDYSKDAAREIVWPALEVYSSKQVYEYLQKLMPREDLLQIALTHLAEGLLKKGNYQLSSEVYDHLQKHFAGNSSQSEWVANQLQAEEQMGRSDRIVELVARLQGNSADSKALQSQVYQSAKKYHSEAQKERDTKTRNLKYDQAIAYYKAFLSLGNELPKQDEVQFFLAEALYTRERYAEAVSYYQAVANKASSRKSTEAAWNWYLTTEKLAEGFQYTGKAKQATKQSDESFLAAARFVASNESLPIEKRRKASYQAARLLYQLNDFDRALPIFKQLADVHKSSKEGRLSAQLVLDIYNLRDDYKAVAKYARDYQQGSTSVEAKELASLEMKALIKAIQKEEEQAKQASGQSRAEGLRSVARKYSAFAKQYADSNLAEGAVWASVQLYATASSLAGDNESRELRASIENLERNFPNSKHRKEAIELLAQYFLDHKVSDRTLQDYARYRADWLAMMNRQPRERQGLLGMMVYRMSSPEQQDQLKERFINLPRSSDNRLAIATAWYEKIEELQANFKAAKINSEKKLKDQTTAKLKLLARLEDQIVKFVELGEPKFAVKSLDILAAGFKNMATAIRQAPIPSILKGADRTQYQAVVESKAIEFDKKAQETQSLARRKAKELGV